MTCDITYLALLVQFHHKTPPNKHPTVTRTSISQPWWVPFTLQLHFSIKSAASLQGRGTGILSSVTLNAVWKYHHLLKRGGDIVTLHKSSPKHCALVSIMTDLYQYSTPTALVCVVIALYVGHVSSVKVRGSVTFHLLLSVHSYRSFCSIMSFHIWKKMLQRKRYTMIPTLVTMAGTLTFTAPCWACCFPAHRINYIIL